MACWTCAVRATSCEWPGRVDFAPFAVRGFRGLINRAPGRVTLSKGIDLADEGEPVCGRGFVPATPGFTLTFTQLFAKIARWNNGSLGSTGEQNER